MEELLRSALPGVDEQTIANLDTKLDELGVISVEDLQYVEEKQINTILKPIQLKNFLQFCHQTLPSSSIMTLDPNSLTSIPTSDENSQEIFNDTNSTASFTTTELSMSSWAHNFEIDWNLFPKEIKEAQDKNTLPLKKHINEMIRILVTQLSNSKKSLGRKEFRIIANKIVGKYPNLFLDKCGDKLIGDGCETLIKKLESCLDNRNRKSIALETNFGTVNKRKTTRDSYGCINWQPSELPEGETKELQMRHKEYLIMEFPKSKRQEEEVEYKMKITYSSQRYFINNLKKSIASVKENWPFLVEEKYLLLHANILLEINLKELFSAAIPEKGKKIFDFMQTKNTKTIRNCLNSIAEAKISVQNQVPEVIGAIPLVMAYFNEEQALLFKEDTLESTENVTLTPYVRSFGTTIYEASEFAVVIDGIPATYTDNFTSALTCLFASYYVYNIEYNEGAMHTMEFIQRCYANINPERGTKAPKKKNTKQYSVSPKVLKLVNELKSFESIFNI